MRRLVSLLLLLATCLTPITGRADACDVPAGGYTKQAVTQDVPVTMSDGVRLRADVIRPASNDGAAVDCRFPVLLTQTPYNKTSPLNFRANGLVNQGYVQVIADVRGTGGSEGVWDSFGTREQLDGAELVRWAADTTHTWSDGRVGLHGTSYGAINQILTAAQNPAGLKATFPVVPMSDAYRDIAVSGGQVNTSFIPSWLGLVTALGILPPTYVAADPVGAAVALASHAGGVLQFQAPAVAKGTTGGDTAFDGPFYRQRSPIEVVDKVTVPTFVVGGWFDLFQRGEPLLYQHLRANNVPTRLLMGPWYHVEAGNNLPNALTLEKLELRWMNRYLKELPDATLDSDIAPVTMFRLGSKTWETASSWPPVGVSYAQKFLGGQAVAGLQNGTLGDAAPSSSSGSDTLVWQPASGPCSRSSAQWTAAGAHQGCEENQRTNDIGGLTYDAAVPAAGANLAGPAAAHLYLSTTSSDAFITARLEDVAADGTATQISAGWNVLSLRALDESKTLRDENGLIVRPYHPFTAGSAEKLVAGTIYDLWIEIFPTAAFIAPGHSLRLSLQASDAPHLSAPLPQTAGLAGGVVSVYHDAAHPSSIVLPVQ